MKKDFFYDEELNAEYIYKNGFTNGDYNHKEALLVAKYFRWNKDYGDARIKTNLNEFCKSNDRNFNVVLFRKSINKIVSESKTDFWKKSQTLFITESEILKIQTLKNFKVQKLALALLAFAKRDNGYVGVNKWVDVKRISGLAISNKEIYKLIKILADADFVEIGKNSHKIKYIDSNSPVVFEISDNKSVFNLAVLYENYCGGEFGYCLICEEQFIKIGNHHRFCKKHADEKKLENDLKKYRKYNKKRLPPF